MRTPSSSAQRQKKPPSLQSSSMPPRKQPAAKSTPAHTGVSKTIERAHRTKVFDISSLVSPSSTSSTSFTQRTSTKENKAEFSLFEATYQTGDKIGLKSGNIYMNGKPHYGHNKVYKEKIGKLLLTEHLRWNDEIKKYHTKIFSYEQAELVLEASKMMSGDDECDLADVSINWSMFKVPHIHIFPLELETTEDGKVLHTAIAGVTFPWKDKLKEAGFNSCNALNGIEGAKGWLCKEPETEDQEAAKVEDLVKDFKKYAWTVNEHNGVA